jgi:AraC-like DNA-binding protein
MNVLKTAPHYLKGFVRFFYTMRAAAYIGQSNVQRRLPDGTLDLVLNIGAPVLLSRDGLNFGEMPRAAVTGLYPDRSFVRYTGEIHLVGAVLQPGAAHLFLHDSLTQFEASTIDAALIFGSAAAELLEKIYATKGEKVKHDLLEYFLLEQFGQRREKWQVDRMTEAVRLIHQHKGNLTMSSLQEACLMSERNFRRKFHELVGMSPKKYAGIIWVKEFSKLYQAQPSSVNKLLLQSGYTDATHLSKDFQKIVGSSPVAYLSELNVMDAEFIHLI